MSVLHAITYPLRRMRFPWSEVDKFTDEDKEFVEKLTRELVETRDKLNELTSRETYSVEEFRKLNNAAELIERKLALHVRYSFSSLIYANAEETDQIFNEFRLDPIFHFDYPKSFNNWDSDDDDDDKK